MKRVIALLLTLVMLLGLVPTALAAEAAAPDGTVVKAEEVSGTPRLDAMAENDSAAETTQPTGHQPDDMVTILVELERAPVLEGFAAKKTASASSAGAEIAAYLAKGGIAVRAGLHCAPLAHESAGTIAQGTVRVSFGHEANDSQRRALVKELAQMR